MNWVFAGTILALVVYTIFLHWRVMVMARVVSSQAELFKLQGAILNEIHESHQNLIMKISHPIEEENGEKPVIQ